MIEQLKQLRVTIDGLAQYTNKLTELKIERTGKVQGFSAQCFQAQDALYMAKAWAGLLLGEVGDPVPYKGGKQTIADIEPTDSVAEINNSFGEGTSRVTKVDALRIRIKDVADTVKAYPMEFTHTREAAICRTNIWNYLCEARLHLGFELQRMKEEHDSNN